MDDDARPLAAGIARRDQRHLGEIEQSLHPGRPRRIDRSATNPRRRRRLRVVRRGSALPAATHNDALTRHLERLDQQHPVLGRQPGPQKQRAVLVEVVVDVLQLMRLPSVLRRHPAKSPQRPLQLRRRQRPRKLEQTLLRRPRRDPRQRPHLAERKLATPERRPQQRRPLQRLRDPQKLTRLTPRDPTTPRHKGLQVAAVALLPHLPDKLEPACRRRAQVRRQARELIHPLPRRRLPRHHTTTNPPNQRCLHRKQV